MSHTPQCCGARQGRSLEVALYSFAMNKGRKLYFSNSTPFALRALPLYSLTETQGERRVNSITPTSGIFNPSPRRYAPQFSPIFSCTTPRNASGHGRGRRLDTNNFLSLPKIVSVALICVICSFFSATRRTNQEAPPFLLTPPFLRTPPLYFALQNTGEEGEMYFFALISVKCDTMGGEIAFFFFGI